jgi:hypothetical protein
MSLAAFLDLTVFPRAIPNVSVIFLFPMLGDVDIIIL